MTDIVDVVARAICKSRTCEGVSCCQWPAQRGRTKCPVDAGGYIDAARSAIDAIDAFRAKLAAPPWDAPYNYSYEPVETLAKEIYDFFEYRGPGTKPPWAPGGNSLKQDEARTVARRQLREAGHVPALPPSERNAVENTGGGQS